MTYTDWQKDNWFHAVRQVIPGVRRLGIEFDHISLDTFALLKHEFPHIEFVDIAAIAMRQRMIKSAVEIAHIEKMTRIADIGGAACAEAATVGTPEHEVALHSTATMVREIARVWPHAEPSGHLDLVPVGINTDGAHNPVTSRRIERGDILSLNCFPMVAGYYVALERTLFAETATDEHLRLGISTAASMTAARNCSFPQPLLRRGARTERDVCERESPAVSQLWLRHSFGVLCHYYGREAGLELREDCDTVLEPAWSCRWNR